MRGKLKPYKPEKISIMIQTSSPPDALGQVTQSWQAGPEVLARVQPISSSEQIAMQLQGIRDRWRVYLPADVRLAVGDHVRFSINSRHRAGEFKHSPNAATKKPVTGKEFAVTNVEQWQSYCLVFVESVS